MEVETEEFLPDKRHDRVSRFHAGTELGPAVDGEADGRESSRRRFELCERFLSISKEIYNILYMT